MGAPSIRSSDVESVPIVEEGLQRTMTAIQGAALIAGAMVGSGIFINPGKILALVGAAGPAMILWIIGAVLATTASMMYAEWGSRLPVSGGDAPFLDHAFQRPRRLLAILYSWVRVVLVNPGYNATTSLAAGTYLASAFPNAFPEKDGDNFYAKIIGAVILLLQTAVCIPSNNLAGNFLTGVSMVSVGTLMLFSVFGLAVLVGIFPSYRVLDNFSADHFFTGTTTNPGDWALAFFKVMWAYDGFSNLASSLGELKDPEKNIGRATYMGIGIVAVLYLFGNLAYLVTMPFDIMVKADDKLAAVWGEHLFGPTGKVLVALCIFACVVACGFISLFSASRIGQATGESGLIIFPGFFKALNPWFGTPVNALVFNTVMTLVLMFAPPTSSTFWLIIDTVSYPLWGFYMLVAVGLLLVKYRSTGSLWARDASVRGVQISALGPMAVIAVAVFLLVFPFTQEDVLPPLLGIAVTVLGFVPYYWLIVRNKAAADVAAPVGKPIVA